MKSIVFAVLGGAAALAIGGCGTAAAPSVAPDQAARCAEGATDCDDTPGQDEVVAEPATGMCLAGATDCNDMGGATDDAFDDATERATAQAMVGLGEDELSPDVRVARRGAETFALTEDYVLGRKTVELDPDAAGTYRVVSVTVELLEGPASFAS